jgi:hypothetical protein
MHSADTSSRALFATAGLLAAIVFSATAVACDDDDDIITPLPSTFVATLNGASEVPPKAVAATGTATIVKNGATYTYTITYSGMTGTLTAAHIHGPAAAGANAVPIVSFTAAGSPASGTLTGTFTGTDASVAATITPDSLDKLMTSGNAYVNLHTAANGGGEIRGQLSKQP